MYSVRSVSNIDGVTEDIAIERFNTRKEALEYKQRYCSDNEEIKYYVEKDKNKDYEYAVVANDMIYFAGTEFECGVYNIANMMCEGTIEKYKQQDAKDAI